MKNVNEQDENSKELTLFPVNILDKLEFEHLRLPFPRPIDFDFFRKREALSQNDVLKNIFDNYENGGERTIFVIPSMSFEKKLLEGIVGINFYESRNLWEVLRARCPRTKVVFCTT